MIEPTTAWYILLIFFICNGILLLNQFMDQGKDGITIATGFVVYALIFYCLYIIKGALG